LPSPELENKLRETICLKADGKRRMWIGTTKDGLWYFDGEKIESEKVFDTIKNTPIRAISGSDTNILWLGTDSGLYQYTKKELLLIIKDVDVWSLSTNEKEGLWCATDGKGIFKISKNDWVGIAFSRIGNEHGLPSDKVFTLFSKNTTEEQTLWIGTNRGIAEYKAGKKPAILRFTRVLGSQIYQASELAKGLDLAYPQNSLVIDVTAISSRTFPEQFQYLFLLFNGKNQIIKQRLAKDTQFLTENLPPGNYRIEVRAYTSALTTSKPIILQFNIASAPFPWTTLSLSILLALSLFALWWGYHQNAKLFGTNRALATANNQLAETRLQLASETENERKRIARDLHDQTLSDLRQLIMMADQLPSEQNGDKKLHSTVFRKEIESISTEIRRICEDLSPSVLTNVGLTAALEWSLTEAIAHLPKEDKFDYEFICDDELEDKINFDSAIQIQIYRIIQEAISNISKHAKAQKVSLKVDISEEDIFTVILSDDGCGFTEGKKTGRGLSNIRSRSSLIEAEVSWKPNPSGGTTFKLQKRNLKTSKSENEA
jgi:signal transduction histidine kinase